MYGSANRDRSQYTNAEQFQLNRFTKNNQSKKPKPVNHLSFGGGMHSCAGAYLARMEGRIAIEILSQRLPNLRLRRPQKLASIPSIMFRGFKQMYLEWE